MATKVARTISIYRHEGRDGVMVERVPGEESGMSAVTAGAPLVYDTGTKELEEWAGGTDASTIVGVAAHNLSGTAGTAVSYYEANPYNLFEGTAINGTDAYTLVAAIVGVSYSLVKSGTNWYVDIADTTTTKVEVVGLVDAVDDINPRVIFRFLQAAWAKVV